MHERFALVTEINSLAQKPDVTPPVGTEAVQC
jgi:hypothetical protein